jgi:hypothetical protein
MIVMENVQMMFPIGVAVRFPGIGRGVVAGHTRIQSVWYVVVRWTSFSAADHICGLGEIEVIRRVIG